ncbi:hypothetical protein [Ureibacillus sinduriensis]|uniref:hypothetical protein n=1 Tax=Ureibacillus sinduriensis TaxID=561440 RepID=UPI00068BDCA3|nr:hypothetical protein [Ureibacillus sinduriensis]
MANGNIRGITIELNGDTTGLDNALRDVNRQSKNLQGELKEVEKALKLDPGNIELVRQKQQLLTQSIQSTSDKLNTLRQVQGQVEAQLRRGEIGEEQYRAFRRELVNAENSMRSFEGQLDSLQTEQQRLADTTRSLGAFFNATGTDVEQFSGTLGTRLTQAIRNGTANADQMERALRLMGRQALGASTDIDEMRRVLNQINNGGSIDSIRSELQQMNQVVVTAQDELKEIDKLLKFNPNSTELLTQKQALLSRSIQDSSTELLQLQQRQREVETQFRSGQMGEEQYRAFRREIEQTEQSLRGYQNELRNMEQEQQAVRSSARQLETLFNATGMSARDFADVLGNDLTRAITEGRATSAQFEQALDRVGRSALGSRADLTQMREALRNIDNGANLDQIRADLDRIANSANQAENDVNGLGDSLANVAGALVAGGGIAGVIEQALDTSNLDTKIDILFEVPEENKEYIKEIIRSIEAYGIDGEEALEAVRRQWALNADATDEANRKIVEGAGVIASAYNGIDFIELIQEINEIAVALNVTDEEALALTNTLLKTGFPPEQLDIIAEYGTQLKIAGYNAEEIQAIMASASSQNSWNIDNLLDGLKEGRIKLTEFGDGWSDALSDLIEGTKISTEMLDGWGRAVAKGGEEGSKAMRDAAQAVSEIEDPTKKALIMVEMFGTMAEDQGNTIANTLIEMGQHMTTAAENQEGLNEAINKMEKDPTVQLRQALADLKTALDPVIQVVADIVSEIATWISENSKLAGVILAVTTALGIVVGAIMALAPAVASLVYLFTPLIGAFTTAGGVAGVFSSAIGGLAPIFTALTGPIGIAVAAITGIVAALVTAYNKVEWFRDGVNQIWNIIKDYTSQAFGAVKELISSLISSGVEFAKGILDKFKAFWDENGKAITEIVKNNFERVKSNIEMVMGIIKGIFEVVWPIISNLVKVVWKAIQLTIGNALDIVLGIIQTVLKLIQGDWKGAWESIKGVAENIMRNIIKFFKDINLFQIGKDVVQGFVNGIGSMASAVVNKAKDLANSVTKTIKNVLDIHSPSREMKRIGLWTGEGLVIGLTSSSSSVNKAMENIGNGILNVSKSYQKEYESLIDEFNKKNEDKNDKTLEKIYKIQNNAAKKKRALTQKEQQEIASLEASYRDSKLKTDQDFNKKYMALVEKSEKEYLEVIKKYIDDKKSLDQMSILDEARIWEQSMELFSEGTTERIKAQQEYKKAVEAVNKEITAINAEYSGQVMKINEELIKSEEALNKAYEDAVSKRENSLKNTKGLFDEFTVDLSRTGDELMKNLQTQIVHFEGWQREIEALSKRAIDGGLLAELREMGPNALAEIVALNSMTDTQLTKYSELYRTKSKWAREVAEKEHVDMKNNTDKQIKEMRTNAEKQLDNLNKEWNAKIKSLTKDTSTELSSLEQIGRDAGNGLLSGLSSTSNAIKSKALDIANSVRKTIQSALDIHSPSRVMKGFGINVGEGLIIGMDDMISKVAQSSARLSEAVVNAQGSLASSAQKSVEYRASSVTSSTSTIDNSKYMQPNITIINQVPNASPSEIARKALQTQRQLAMEWGV